MTTTPGAPSPAPDRERAFGLLLFDAEESLARGDAEKAMVLASRAVKERPDSLTARALVERARFELTRGRRREKLDARIGEAERLLDAGDFAAAEKIVSSALKLVPDHAVALVLFGRLRDRPRATTAEVEADRELTRIARSQAEQALEAARAARAAGWDRRAVFHLRRGLRQAPDHPALLALLGETHGAIERVDAERARKRALATQVRAGLELLAGGDRDGALRILRAVLEDDPDNVRAQAAVQEVRRALLGPVPPAAAASAPEPGPVERPAPRAPMARAVRPREDAVTDRSLPFVPVEILLPRTRRHRTSPALVIAGGALLLGAMLYLSGRTSSGGSGPAPSTAPAPPATESAATTTAAPEDAGADGPLAVAEPALRQAIERTTASYARALESGDGAALSAARPDLGPERREARLAPFVGAINAATDIRVLDVVVSGDQATVSILSTDVIIGGRGTPPPPSEEELVFERRAGAWDLAARPR